MTREGRREEALRAAEACAALLKERFGARRVVLFGSWPEILLTVISRMWTWP